MSKLDFLNLINQNFINKFRLLISYYQKIFLNDEELLLILHIFNKMNFYNEFLAAFEIAKNTNFTIKKINCLLENLIKKNFLEIINEKKTQRLVFNFNHLFLKIYDVISKKNSNLKLVSNAKKENVQFIDFDWLNH